MPPSPPSPPFSSQDFRRALGMFATGVTVVGTPTGPAEWLGVTVSSFNSVSLTPPLVLWSLGLQSRKLAVFRDCTHFSVNVLRAEQLPLAQHFAGPNPSWSGVAHDTGIGNVPVLADSLAVFECARRSQYTEGDHLVFVGEVLRCTQRDGTPLLYHGGRFYTERSI